MTPEESKGAVCEIHCEQADEVMGVLHPAHQRWQHTRCMFRGQADASWPLIPSCMREKSWIPFGGQPLYRWRKVNDGTRPFAASILVKIEWELLQEFEQAADHLGLSLPEDTQESRLNSEGLPATKDWPLTNKLSVLALAQHYGVPTRLLDWSWTGKIAAYFAAIKVAEALRSDCRSGELPSGRLAIWALDAEFLEVVRWRAHGAEPELRAVTAPYASNPNLSAQRGVFTLDRNIAANRSFEEAVKALQLADDSLRPRLPLSKITLPHGQARRLLKLLAIEDVHAGTVYPGYRGVTLSLLERRLWTGTDMCESESLAKARGMARDETVTSGAPPKEGG